MKHFLLMCVAGLVLVAVDGVDGQQGGSQPGRLPTLEVELANLQQDAANKQAEEQAARERAAATERERRAQMEQLNRQRQADETDKEYRAWQRRQQEKFAQAEKEAQAARAERDMAAYRAKEAAKRLQDRERQTGVTAPPRPAQPGTAQPPTTSPQQIPRHLIDRRGAVWNQLIQEAQGKGQTFTIPNEPVIRVVPGGRDPMPLRLPPPQTQVIPGTQSRDRGILLAPGGIIFGATADIAGLRVRDVASASFDSTTGILTLSLRSGKNITYPLDADDFTVAVRSVFDRQVDPVLSMTFEADKPGFKAVEYAGPLFKTRFGKIMYDIDDIFGSIMFNREGDHRALAGAFVPPGLVYEADITRRYGTRVYLLSQAVDFAVENDRLVCKRVDVKVQVTATDYMADYMQESMYRVGRAVEAKFEGLTQAFPEFKEFRRLAEHIALAKWLKQHAIAFDWSELRTRRVAEHDMPAYVPANDWNRAFNGRNLDGWRLNLSSGQCESLVTDTYISLKPTGQEALQVRAKTWAKTYDLRYAVQTEGPLEVVVRDGAGGSASVTIDTKGQVHAIEVFFRDGKWSALAPGVQKQGELTMPQPRQGERTVPSEYGFRVPPGSTMMLYAAAMRRW